MSSCVYDCRRRAEEAKRKKQEVGILGNRNVLACLSQSGTKFRRNGVENGGESACSGPSGLEDAPKTCDLSYSPKQDTAFTFRKTSKMSRETLFEVLLFFALVLVGFVVLGVAFVDRVGFDLDLMFHINKKEMPQL